MNVFHSLSGTISLTITAADPAQAISDLFTAGIPILDSCRNGEDIAIQVCFQRKDYRRVKALAKRRGYQVSAIKRQGFYWPLRGLLKRPVLVAGFLFILFITLFVPTRVLFIRVEGNLTVPENLILEKCAEYGIIFGASREEIRSEKLKNALLEAIPELQWAGINTSGCVATVSVRERTETPDQQTENDTGICSIVAARDGIITKYTATKGNVLCKVGQAVTEGEVLVSGYTDCGISIRAVRAEAEIYAQTERSVTAVMDSQWTEKGEVTSEIKRYALIIGKKRINFYKDSGISDTGCDRIYSQTYLTLPGGFQLPVLLVTETWIYYDQQACSLSGEDVQDTLSDFCTGYLKQQMVAGEILSCREFLLTQEDLHRLTGNYFCHEMIGQIKNEEIISPHGKYD